MKALTGSSLQCEVSNFKETQERGTQKVFSFAKANMRPEARESRQPPTPEAGRSGPCTRHWTEHSAGDANGGHRSHPSQPAPGPGRGCWALSHTCLTPAQTPSLPRQWGWPGVWQRPRPLFLPRSELAPSSCLSICLPFCLFKWGGGRSWKELLQELVHLILKQQQKI